MPPRISFLRRLIRNRLFRDRKGATAIEYGLIAAFIAMAALVAMRGIGSQLRGTLGTVSTAMSSGAAAA